MHVLSAAAAAAAESHARRHQPPALEAGLQKVPRAKMTPLRRKRKHRLRLRFPSSLVAGATAG